MTLSFSERFSHLIRGGAKPYAWNIAAAVFAQGTTLLAALLVSRLFGVAQFGRYAIGQTTIVTAAALLTVGLSITLNAEVARDRARDPISLFSSINFGLTVGAALGITGGAAMFALAPIIAASIYNDSTAIVVLQVASIAIPLAVLTNIYTGILAGLEAFRWLALSSVLQFLVTLAVAVLGAKLAGAGGVLAAVAAGYGVRILLNRFALRSILPDARRLPLTSLWETWVRIRLVATPAALAGATIFPAMWLANAALVKFGGLGGYGLFSAALLVKTAVTFVPLQLGSVVLSRGTRLRSEGRHQDAARQLRRALAFTSILTIVAAICIWLAPKKLMLVFGEHFAGASAILDLMMIVAVLEALATLMVYEIFGQRKFWLSFIFYSTPKDIILVALAWVMAPSMGEYGVVIAYASSWTYGLLVAVTLLVLKVDNIK